MIMMLVALVIDVNFCNVCVYKKLYYFFLEFIIIYSCY